MLSPPHWAAEAVKSHELGDLEIGISVAALVAVLLLLLAWL